MMALALFSLVGYGCGKSEEPKPSATPRPAAPVRQPIQKQVSTARPAHPQESGYDFTGKKDPFRPYVVAKPKLAALPQAKEKLLPIQQFEVNQFKCIGIITGLAENRAMVVDPTGKSYVIKVGALIGPNDGRVKRIEPAFIEVTEMFSDDNGKAKPRVVRLTLPRKE